MREMDRREACIDLLLIGLGLVLPRRSSAGQTVIYPSFDDLPGEHLGEIVNVLDAYGQKATFFLEGGRMADGKYHDLLVAMVKNGHVLGNHSYSHPFFSEIDDDETREFEVKKTYELINGILRDAELTDAQITAYPLLFRNPYGDSGGKYKKQVVAVQEKYGYSTYGMTGTGGGWTKTSTGWDNDPRDYENDVETAKRIALHAQSGQIIDLHGKKDTPEIVQSLLNHGRELRTLPKKI